MRTVSRSIGAIAGCGVLVMAMSVFAQDWPQWRGVNRDGNVAGFAAPAAWPKELTQKWKVTVGPGDSTPALVGDRLYVCARQGDDEVILCLDAGTGQVVWQDKYAAQAVTGPAARHPGPRASPAVAGGKVVTLGVGGVVSCLDAATGKVAWRKDPFPKVVPMFFAAMSPMILDGMAIAHVGGKGQGAILAFDLAGGDQKWAWAGEAPQYASPVLLTVEGVKQVVALTEKSVVGVGAADGKLLWQAPFVPSGRAYNNATPIISGQMVIFTGAGRGTKAVKIEKKADGFAATEVWSNPDVATGFNTPVLDGGFLFGMSEGGNFFAISAASGKTAWTGSAKVDRFCAMVGAGPTILALPSTGELIAFKASEKGYEELARIKVSDTPTFAHPVVAGNRIFVRGDTTLALLALP